MLLWEKIKFLVDSSSHQKHIDMLEHCTTGLNVVTRHCLIQTRFYEFREENFSGDSTSFSEKKVSIRVLSPEKTRSGKILYLFLLLPIITFFQLLSASLSIYKVILITSSDLHTYDLHRQYLLSNLSFMCLNKSKCIRKNQLHCWIHTLLAFQHIIYRRVFLMPEKWLQTSFLKHYLFNDSNTVMFFCW